MDINQFSYFLEICKTGRISKAADNLHITQQGLSISMRRLEAELGCDLFYHKGSGLVLTDNGLFLKSEAEAIVRHMDKIHKYYSEKKVNKTVVSVSVTDSLIVRLPIKLQRLFINGNDSFIVNLHENYSRACVDSVLEGETDFAVVYGKRVSDELEFINMDGVQQVIIVNKEHPFAQLDEVSIKMLDGQPFVAPDKLSWPRIDLAEKFAANGAKLDVVYECNRPRQTINIVTNNPKLIARVVLPELTTADLQNISVLRLKDDPFILPINLVYNKNIRSSQSKKEFLNMILNAYDN